jgi:hypothetical protein
MALKTIRSVLSGDISSELNDFKSYTRTTTLKSMD